MDAPAVHVPRPAAEWVIASDPGVKHPPFAFAAEDERFLDEVQRATFGFLWNACSPTTGMVVDRSSVTFASVAGVGFQLAAIPAAIERGWLTREQGEARALQIVRALDANPNNRKFGVFYHFLRGDNAGPVDMDVVSTVDTALLFAGMLVSASYFGGEVDAISTRLVSDADWSAFRLLEPQPNEQFLKGFLSLGWKPRDPKRPTGEGDLLKYAWVDSADEHRLIYFFAVASEKAEHRVDPAYYYRLRRAIGTAELPGVEPHSFFPWSGAFFTNTFAHLFINYAGMGADDPAANGVARRARIDWWENSRRAANFHRAVAISHAGKVPSLGENAWGLTANDAADGYQVPGVFPKLIPFSDAVPEVDVSTYTPKDKLGGGNVAPYGAGMAIMFEPAHAIAALRHYRSLKTDAGEPLVWRDPSRGVREAGNPFPVGDAYGFRDSYNLGTGWVAPDYVAIDQGPLFLAIENARSGLTWSLFHKHPLVKGAMGRLGLSEK